MKKQKESGNKIGLQKAKPGNEIQPSERAKLNAEICAVAGVQAPGVGSRILSQLETMQVWGAKLPDNRNLVVAFEMMAELKPTNATEALLAVQMIGVHEAALLFLRRATLEGQTFQGADANVLRATRLMRLFQEQLSAMAKLKGKAGHQKVTVEHVQVHQGGQAIVGSIRVDKGNQGEESS